MIASECERARETVIKKEFPWKFHWSTVSFTVRSHLNFIMSLDFYDPLNWCAFSEFYSYTMRLSVFFLADNQYNWWPILISVFTCSVFGYFTERQI